MRMNAVRCRCESEDYTPGWKRLMLPIAIVVSLAFTALSSGVALADTTIGHVGVPSEWVGYAPGWEHIQSDTTAPTDGVITSFNTQSGACGGPFSGGTYNFQVLHPLDSTHFQVVGETGNRTDPCDGAPHSYTVNIPIQAGDVIGVYVVADWQGVLSSTDGTHSAAQISEPAVGTTIITSQTPIAGTIDESATLVADSTPPTSSIDLTPAGPNGSNGWYVSNVHAAVSAVDNSGGSGVSATRCVLDPASVPATYDAIPSGCAYLGPAGADITAEGQHALYVASVDTDGNKETPVHVTFKIDKTAPTIGPLLAITKEALAPLGTKVDFTVPSSDLVSGLASTVCTPKTSGSVFPIGATIENCTATDNAGNSANASFTVTIQHTYAPAITVPAWVHANAVNASGARVYYTASAYDLVDGPVEVRCWPASGSLFPLGTTTVRCHAHDHSGHTSYASFPVFVHDHTAPVITAPSITAEATSGQGAKVSYVPSAVDNVDGVVAVSCTPTSGSTFPIGLTRVYCSARDRIGNVGHAAFDLVVVHTAGPVLLVPETVTGEATGPSGAAVTFKVSGYDAVDGAVTPSCTPASLSVFALGTTHVTCTAVDKSGHSSSATFHVLVHDTIAPKLMLPAAKKVWTRSSRGAVVSYTASAYDPVDGASTPKCRPSSGSRFKLGTTAVVCSAADRAGNVTTGSFTVTVRADLPKITAVSQSAAIWRLGQALARYASATAPVGTTFRYSVDRGAEVAFAFTKKVGGRTVTVATLHHRSHAGKNSLHFEGRLNRNRWLTAGTYTLRITATANGLHSKPAILMFTIQS